MVIISLLSALKRVSVQTHKQTQTWVNLLANLDTRLHASEEKQGRGSVWQACLLLFEYFGMAVSLHSSADQWVPGFGATWEDDAQNPYPSRGGNGATSASVSRSDSWAPPLPISQATRYNSPQPSARRVPVPTPVSNLRNQFPPPNPTTALPRFPQPGPQRNPAMQFQTGFGMPQPGPSIPPRRPRPPPEPMSQTLEFVTKSLDQPLPEDVPRIANPHDMKIAESRGAALVDATRAFYGNHRSASVSYHGLSRIPHECLWPF
jgi:hypothetical protein